MANYSIILSCIAVLAHTFPLASAHLIPSPIVFDQLIYNQENLDLDDDILSNPVPVIFLYSAENARESQDDVVSVILAAEEREEIAEEYAAEEEAEAAVLHRSRRQIRVPPSFDLSSSHNDKYGAPRPVGKIHGFLKGEGLFHGPVNGANSHHGLVNNAGFRQGPVNGAGFGNSFKNYNLNAGVGLGSVIFRSKDKKHSLGVGATVGQSFGSFQGENFKTKPDIGAGLGYKFSF